MLQACVAIPRGLQDEAWARCSNGHLNRRDRQVRCLAPFCPPDQSFCPPRGLYTGRAMKSYISNLTYHLSAPITRTSAIHPFHLPGRSFALLATFAAILAVLGLSSCTTHTSAAGTSPATPSTAGPAVSTTPGLVITTSSLPSGQGQAAYTARWQTARDRKSIRLNSSH